MDFTHLLEKNFPITCENVYLCALIPDRWEKIVFNCIKEIDAKYSKYVRIVQIKEKFNRLRIYYDLIDDSDINEKDRKFINKSVDDIINKAELSVDILENYFR